MRHVVLLMQYTSGVVLQLHSIPCIDFVLMAKLHFSMTVKNCFEQGLIFTVDLVISNFVILDWKSKSALELGAGTGVCGLQMSALGYVN